MTIQKCKIKWCNGLWNLCKWKRYFVKWYCNNHYDKYRKYWDVLVDNRTKQEYIIKTILIIIVTDEGVFQYAMLDYENYDSNVFYVICERDQNDIL